MWMMVIWLGLSVGPLAVGPRLMPGARTGFLEPVMGYFAQPDSGEGGLFLPQLGIPDFGDFPWEALSL